MPEFGRAVTGAQNTEGWWQMEFDYVIIGGGSAGCVLAARLSEDPAIRVCLL